VPWPPASQTSICYEHPTGGLREIITGAGPGGGPHVKVIEASKISQLQSDGQIADSALVAQFYAYSPFFDGGVRAAADLNGDGVLDIVTGAGTGGGPAAECTWPPSRSALRRSSLSVTDLRLTAPSMGRSCRGSERGGRRNNRIDQQES
jgi:hypothetical protein